MRRWLLALLVLLFLAAVARHLPEVAQLLRVLRHGDWRWVLAAAAVQGVYYLLCTAVYREAFGTVGVAGRIGELLPVWFASICVNSSAPTAGPLIFVDDAALRGQSAARATAGVILVRVADFGTFALVLLVGLGVLAHAHHLRLYQLLGTLILLLIVGGWAWLLVLGQRHPDSLLRLLGWAASTANRAARRLRRPPLLAADWAEANAIQFSAAAGAIAGCPTGLVRTLATALAAHLVSFATLCLCFLAFHQTVPLPIILSGFCVGLLFWIVSIGPEGVGVVEPLMLLVYRSLGVPTPSALAVILLFRGLTFWLPLALGVVLLRRARSFRSATPGDPRQPKSQRLRRTSGCHWIHPSHERAS
jgi:uncharacterized protein (TIRG00374 family)